MVSCENDGAFCGHVAPPDDVHLLKTCEKVDECVSKGRLQHNTGILVHEARVNNDRDPRA